MKKWLIGCLILFSVWMPTAYGAEEVVIRNTSINDIQSFLLDEAKKADLIVRERSDAFLILHLTPKNSLFPKLWGSQAYLRCVYRFYPQGNDTRVTYETQAVNGAQNNPFSAWRIGDYHGKRLPFAQDRLVATVNSLISLRMQFDEAYLYGLTLAPKKGDTVKIDEVLPETPAQLAGLHSGDEVSLFAGLPTKYASNFGLFYRYLQGELKAEPLTLTILRDGKKRSVTIVPKRCTAEEYAAWAEKYLSEKK